MAENYFRLTSLDDNNVISLQQNGSPSAISLQYRTDLNQEWQQYVIGTELTLFKDSWIEFRNTSGTFSTGESNYYKFTSTKKFNASGKIGSLLFYSQDPITAVVSNAFNNLFDGTSIVDASQLKINLNRIGIYGCQKMFLNCIYLTKAPELPSLTLSNYCYDQMFYGCTSLTEAPELPATTLANSCYSYMFYGCTSLTKAPELPATKLASGCYTYMFTNTNVSHIVWGSASRPGGTFSSNWLLNASSTGTFYYTDNTIDVSKILRSQNGVPADWTIKYLRPTPNLVFSINDKAVTSLTINGKTVSKLG